MEVPVAVGAEIALRVGVLPPEAERDLRAALQFDNPELVTAERLGKWTGKIDPTVKAWRTEGETIYLPRGTIRTLKQVAEAHGYTIAVQSNMALGAGLCVGGMMHELRPYQQEAVEAATRGVQGQIVIPCGGGKTQVGIGLMHRLDRTALVLVHTKDLARQWVERVRDVLGMQAGTIGEGVVAEAPITIGLVQTLDRWEAERVASLGRRFGLLIVDEAHHGPASTYLRLLGLLPCRWRIGLTATPERDDGLTPMLEWCFGPVLYRVEQRELIDLGYLVAPEYVQIRSDFKWDGDATNNFAGLVTDVCQDECRNRLIVQTAVQELSSGGTLLILSTRKEHCADLAAALTKEGVTAEVLTSDTPAKKRAGVLDGLRDGSVRCACATQLADEGLDVPRLSAVLLVAPTRAANRTIQRIGRTMRPAPGKDVPRVYDIVDMHVGVLANQAHKRRLAFIEACGQPARRRPAGPGMGGGQESRSSGAGAGEQCPVCGDPGPRRMRWQRIDGGRKYIRQDCARCGKLVPGQAWAQQTPENIARADAGGWYGAAQGDLFGNRP